MSTSLTFDGEAVASVNTLDISPNGPREVRLTVCGIGDAAKEIAEFVAKHGLIKMGVDTTDASAGVMVFVFPIIK